MRNVLVSYFFQDGYCFVCKQLGATTSCPVTSCVRNYHLNCLKPFKSSTWDKKAPDVLLSCPFHVCATCSADGSNPDAYKGQFLQCVKCPVAYHSGDFCVAAGSIVLGPRHIICADHISLKKEWPPHVNAALCFNCHKLPLCVSTTMPCRECPAVYHA